VLDAAVKTGADAIHPGYGFLSENPSFVRACNGRGVVFVGPPAQAIEALGDKTSAKQVAEQAGVPVLPGLHGPELSDEQITRFAELDGRLPLMIKAAAGGGGRGMRIVRSRAELPGALAAARREARAAFGDDGLLVERYVERARHIETQFLIDHLGGAIHLGERECSLQRRHQKLVEESPSPVVGASLRERLGEAACGLARAVGYIGAGTAEFLMSADDPEQEWFFLEVNARLQVEHPVTELVSGLDLVEQQLRLAAGERLSLEQSDVELAGHAIEVRLCAENPAADFLPATGEIVLYREPCGAGVRVDSGVEVGSTVTSHYDSLLAKLIAYGADRRQALERLTRALQQLRVFGVTTNAEFLARLIASPEVCAGELDTKLIERGVVGADADRDELRDAAIAVAVAETLSIGGSADPWDALVGWRIDGSRVVEWELESERSDERVTVAIDGPPQRARVRVGDDEGSLSAAFRSDEQLTLELDGRRRAWDTIRTGSRRWVGAGAQALSFRILEPVVEQDAGGGQGALEAPMPGTVLIVNVAAGDEVHEGDVLVVVESMKMELSLVAPIDAMVAEVLVTAGDGVAQGQSLVALEAGA
jgi:acetyl-CoA/propionyl-CoA carboxylase biotin carboxyl carrier protein